MTSGYPPSSAMPTLNETRVRVECLSKSTATARGPASGWRTRRLAFIASARSSTSRSSAGLRSSSRRKCLGICVAQRGAQSWHRLVHVGFGQDQRRRQADHVGLDGVDQEAMLAGVLFDGGRELTVQNNRPPQPRPPDLADQRAVHSGQFVDQVLAY